MDYFTYFIVIATLLTSLKADQYYQGPQRFPESDAPAQKYGMKEVTMYLTPTQLKSLEEARILVRADANGVPEYALSNQDQKLPEQLFKEQSSESDFKHLFDYDSYQNNVETRHDFKSLKDYYHVPPVEEPNADQELDFASGFQLHDKLTEPPFELPSQHPSYAYIHFSSHGQPDTNIQMFYPQPKEHEHLQLPIEPNFEIPAEPIHQNHKFIPLEHIPEKHTEGFHRFEDHGSKPMQLNIKRNPGVKHRKIFKYVQRKVGNK